MTHRRVTKPNGCILFTASFRSICISLAETDLYFRNGHILYILNKNVPVSCRVASRRRVEGLDRLVVVQCDVRRGQPDADQDVHPAQYGGSHCKGVTAQWQNCSDNPCPSRDILPHVYYNIVLTVIIKEMHDVKYCSCNTQKTTGYINLPAVRIVQRTYNNNNNNKI